MTEQEWLECAEPWRMLEQLRHGSLRRNVSDRGLRLFGVWCCRRIQHLMIDRRSQVAVDKAEQFAEGTGTLPELDAFGMDAYGVIYENDEVQDSQPHRSAAYAASGSAGGDAWEAAQAAANNSAEAAFEPHEGQPEMSDADYRAAVAPEVAVLRDLVGNPFRPVTADPSWLTATVDALATAIYDERAFDRLPILADALEDAGCTNADILNHCRQPGEHVRGCWVVDLVLGKS